MSALCRSRRELSVSPHVPFLNLLFETDSYSNEYLLAKFGFDTAENEPYYFEISSSRKFEFELRTYEPLICNPINVSQSPSYQTWPKGAFEKRSTFASANSSQFT